MKKQLILFTIGSSLMLAPLALRAEDTEGPKPGGPPHREMKHGPKFERLIPPGLEEKLKLTEDQKTKIKAIEDSFKKTREEYMAAHKAEFEAGHEAMKAARESNDEGKRKEAGQKLRGLREGMAEHRKVALDQVKSLLTDEQKKLWEEEKQKFQEKHPGRKGPKS
jgi:Spy/CpxP family protein refolding chaperone